MKWEKDWSESYTGWEFLRMPDKENPGRNSFVWHWKSGKFLLDRTQKIFGETGVFREDIVDLGIEGGLEEFIDLVIGHSTRNSLFRLFRDEVPVLRHDEIDRAD